MKTGVVETLKNELRICCDWMSFNLDGMSVDEVCEFLGYGEQDYLEMNKGGMGYRSMRRIKGYNISILYDGSVGMGILVSCSGSAITELVRSYAETKAIDTPFGEKGWEFSSAFIDFVQSVNLTGRFTRFDIALDDIGAQYYTIDYLYNLLDSSDFRAKEKKRVVMKMKKYLRYDPKIHGTSEKEGDTLYLGSRRSDTFIRVYDKRLEQKSKTKEDLGIDWVRWEIEFKGDRAQQVARAIGEQEEMANVFIGVLNNYFCIKNIDDSNISRCSVDSLWEKFVCATEKVRLFVAQAEKTLEEKEIWFKTQVAPTLAGIIVSRMGDMGIVYDFFSEYLTKMSRDMVNICDRYNPTWRMDWGFDDGCVL